MLDDDVLVQNLGRYKVTCCVFEVICKVVLRFEEIFRKLLKTCLCGSSFNKWRLSGTNYNATRSSLECKVQYTSRFFVEKTIIDVLKFKCISRMGVKKGFRICLMHIMCKSYSLWFIMHHKHNMVNIHIQTNVCNKQLNLHSTFTSKRWVHLKILVTLLQLISIFHKKYVV